MKKRHIAEIAIIIFLPAVALAQNVQADSVSNAARAIQSAFREGNMEALWQLTGKVTRQTRANNDYGQFVQNKRVAWEVHPERMRAMFENPLGRVRMITPNRAWVEVKPGKYNPAMVFKGYYLVKEDSQWKHGALNAYFSRVDIDMDFLAAAIRRYYAGKKHLPRNLPDLVPEYLADLPLDPFCDDKKNYGYRITGKTAWKLYSVGIDSRDNFGLAKYSINTEHALLDFAGGDIIREYAVNAPDEGYNIIMLSMTNVGADHMSLYGYKRKTTPNIDKFARNAVVFESNFSLSSWTLPAAASLFTGQYPYTHKIMSRFTDNRLDHNTETLPKILKKYGYKTAAFTAGLDYRGDFGFSDGFDIYETSKDDLASFNEVLPEAKEWLSRQGRDKFFLFVQGYDSHCPFTPPDQFKNKFSSKNYKSDIDAAQAIRGYEISNKPGTYIAYYVYSQDRPKKQVRLSEKDMRHLSDLYDEEVAYADYLVGNFLDFLKKEGLFKNTVIILLSEHGEMFARHGRFGRAGQARGTFYDDVLRVPLIIRFPGGDSKRIKEFSQVTDILPTLLDWLKIPLIPEFQGKSLLGLLRKNGGQVHEYVFSGTTFNRARYAPYRHYSDMRMIRSKKWKLIHETIFRDDMTPKEDIFEFYDIKNDPGELRNLYEENSGALSGKLDELKLKLSEWEKESRNRGSRPSTAAIPHDLAENAYKYGYW